ncbi:hypothetical protein J1N35_018010 [Gossypium stocksii]|uniref:Reverse transcriptase zinc-binding domain-containing protein n=1 Tax=Gossypium stocksii TaxID=47602 RepID=A0A9D3VQA8_9ROSI|nr:hypothetical protein J1N35_018010 [Gossypium stocksii]
MVGPTVCDWVKRVFNGGDIESGLNNTLIILIPKTQNSEEFAQFHPISLCFVLYKLVMKVLWNDVPMTKFRPVRGIRQGEDNWNINFLQDWLPNEIISHILRISPPHPVEGPDRLVWRHTSTEAFSVKSAYKVLKEDSWSTIDELWKKAWIIPGPQRVRFFFWTFLKQRLLTNVERVRRGLAVDASCQICGHASEDILHIIRDCPMAKEDTSTLYGREISWACLFGLLAWRLWKNRNLSIFQGKAWSSNEVINVSLCWAKHATLNSRIGLSDNTAPLHVEITSKDWVFLYADGVVSRTSGRAAAGGVIRDSSGDWVMGYSRFLGNYSVFDAELWGIWMG